MPEIGDLRSFLEAARRAGEVHEIRREVDPVRELGRVLAACERAGKAAYFHAVKGFDIPVVGSLLSSPKRIALALGCEVAQIGERMAAATEKPIAPVLHPGRAPCQEVVVKKPDLTKWPIPTHSPLDAGPFITAGVVIARDPESGRHNLSYNRMQIYGPDRAGVSMNIWRHIKAFFDKREPRGENLPFAVALGPDPVVMMAAAFRYDGDEYEVAGSLRGAPIPVVKALTCDLLVPAFSEIILEGEVLAGERQMEGPMAEFTGHYSGADPKHVAKITAITHRAKPIFQTMNGGGYEHVSLGNMITREPLLARFVRHISPRVSAVHLPPYAAGFTAIVALNDPQPGEARNVAIAAMAAHVNFKTVIVVDSDVDIFDPADVMWALATRVRWHQDVVPIPGAHGNELDPSTEEHGVASKAIIDATLPPEKHKRYVKVAYPPVDLERYLKGN
ncbi:MAG TPA: UbiD family decarboxylase [Burkholderiales bacterium]|nr:UbiD family decarboxylase [Burkholderiales bacterium]